MSWVTRLARWHRSSVLRGLVEPLLMAAEWRETAREFRRFERDRQVRRDTLAGARFRCERYPQIVAALENDGLVVIPRVVPVQQIADLRARVEGLLDRGTAVKSVARDAGRPAGSTEGAQEFLEPHEVARGQAYCRHVTNHMTIANPLIHCPQAVDLAFDERLIDIAAGYLECLPAIGGLNLRKSFVNPLPELDTLLFHVDPNSPRFLKFFFYLNDVDASGGPFCYVLGSHRERFPGWRAKYRWTYDEMVDRYGVERILNVTARAGDLIVADTTGFHRGTKTLGADRTMLTVDYVVHPEFQGRQARSAFQLDRQRFRGLSAKQQAAADFLEIVESTPQRHVA